MPVVSFIETPLGRMVALADHDALMFLLFDSGNHGFFAGASLGTNWVIERLKMQLDGYFSGLIRSFDVPLTFQGTDFQKKAWNALLTFEYGKRVSYSNQAKVAGHPNAWRAIGSANKVNPINIIVPCHRVIRSSGNLGGYAGGIDRKAWLLRHEQ